MEQDQTLKVRDRRGAKWLWLDNAIIDAYLPLLSTTTFAIYVLLCRYANDNNGECFPSHGTIAAKLNIGTGTVKRSLKELEKLNLIETVSGAKLGVSNIYRLLEVPKIEVEGRSLQAEGVDHHGPTPLDHHGPTNNTKNEQALTNNTLSGLTPDAGHNGNGVKESVDQCLKDAVATHIQGIAAPGIAFTGVLAQAVARVWRGKKNVKRLDAEQYKAIARSIPVYVKWRKQQNKPGLPQTASVLETDYTRFAESGFGQKKNTPTEICKTCEGERQYRLVTMLDGTTVISKMQDSIPRPFYDYDLVPCPDCHPVAYAEYVEKNKP